jgi:hypothetical protein
MHVNARLRVKSRRPNCKTRLLSVGSTFAYLACLVGWTPRAQAATLVDLDATSLPEGPLPAWNNTGTLGGSFTSSGTETPEIVTVDGAKAVQFSATTGATAGTSYLGPAAPASVTGNGARTVEAWIWDAAADTAGEKIVIGWGRRGADGINNAFGHGTNPAFGAVGHWGAYDTGYGSPANVVYDRWTHVVYTYDPATQSDYIYVDGKLANVHAMPNPLNTASVSTATPPAPLPFRVQRQNAATGAPSGTGVGRIAIARVRVSDSVMSQAEVQAKLAAEKNTFWADTDTDGIPDWYEDANGLVKTDPADAAADSDTDGATNLQEFTAGTNPASEDSDGDGVTDGAELNRKAGNVAAPTNPLAADTDGDGLSDKVETGTGTFASATDTGSDPLKADTDGDTFKDGTEVLQGSNPNLASSVPPAEQLPLLDLNAAPLTEGLLATWTNAGVLGGEFTPVVGAGEVQTLDGAKGLTLGGGDTYYRGPLSPVSVTGNPNVTIEAWVYNPTIEGEESVIAWGRRGGPDGSAFSFNHGSNAAFGATTHWGAYDVGWNGVVNAGRWTHIAEVYNAATHTTRLYVDGKLVNNYVEPGNLNVWAVDTTGARLPFTLGAQNNDNGTVSTGQLASLSVGRLRIWDSTKTDAGIKALFDAGKATYWPDADTDGLPDWYENLYSPTLNPNLAADATQDSDTDGLTNLQEFSLGTDPTKADTDADGLKDGVETNTGTFVGAADTGTNPLVADTDADGLKDGVETNTNVFKNSNDTGTSPFKADTDNDTIKDGTEVFLGSNPLDPNSKPGSDPIVKLDATTLPDGPLEVWPNTGAMGGDFTTQPDAVPAIVETVAGVKGVTFDGVNNYYTGPAQPPAFTGNADHAIEAWVFNPTIEAEEGVFAWGRRGGPDGSNVSFGHGSNAIFGAVGHWGTYDVGWNGNLTANAWTFIAYNYTASNHVTRVYRDGALANTVPQPGNLNTWGVDTAGNPLLMRVGAQNLADGNVDTANRPSLTIAKIRVYAVALADSKVAADYAADKDLFGGPKILTQSYDTTAGKFTLTWNAIAGSTYAIDASSDLSSAANWGPIATGLSVGTFTETVPAGSTARFYRLRVE